MPHGSRFSADGTHHYSACMMDDMLVEIDTRKLAVSRYFVLTAGKAMATTRTPPRRTLDGATQTGGSHDMSGHGMEPPKPGDVSCSPTWAQPSPARPRGVVTWYSA